MKRAPSRSSIVLPFLLAGCGAATPPPQDPASAVSSPAGAPSQATTGSSATTEPGSTVRFECAPVSEMPSDPSAGNVVQMPIDDPALIAARKEAAATLGTFRKGLAAKLPEEVIFSLKVGLPTRAGQREHIWVSDVKADGEGFRGVLDNEPVDLDLAAGDMVQIHPSQVEDWMIIDPQNPRFFCGGFTTRAVFARQK